jgi:hypothetical protein
MMWVNWPTMDSPKPIGCRVFSLTSSNFMIDSSKAMMNEGWPSVDAPVVQNSSMPYSQVLVRHAVSRSPSTQRESRWATQIKEALTRVSASLVNWVTAVAAVAAAAAAG